MAEAVGLVDQTPAGFASAAANETDPSPAEINDFYEVLAGGAVEILVYNTQTEGAVPAQIRSTAESAGVAVLEVTESPPESSTFLAWQLEQLAALGAVVDSL